MTKNVTINLENEKQIRKFIQMNTTSSCQVDVRSGHSYIDGKSIIGLLSLNLLKPLSVSVIGESNKISALISSYEESNLVAG
jgi:phosphotransferase system HPr-like phosphotransfer protein